ncbi:hypothetical protein [Clostridium sp. JNZ J1-5]
MKKNRDIKDHIIDKYYGEEYDKDLLKADLNRDNLSEIEKFEEKLKRSGEKMDSISDMDFDLDTNIMDIIVKAEEINYKKKSKRETLYFILAALGILGILAVATVFLEVKHILYLQIGFIAAAPLIIVPIVRAALKREGGTL